MKDIPGRIYAFWLLVCFAVTLILIAIPTAICQYTMKDEVKKTATILKGYRIWMKILMILVFCRIRVKGKNHFQKGQNYIVTVNHNALFDILVSTPSVPFASKTLAKSELAKIPIFGLVYRSGSILVNRKSARSRAESMKKMKHTLAQGMHLILYPEGTRNKTSAPLKSFHDGAFAMAIEEQKPIIPALLFNTRKILPPNKKFFARPQNVSMHFLNPISVKGLTHEDVPKLKQEVFQIMYAYFEKNQDLL